MKIPISALLSGGLLAFALRIEWPYLMGYFPQQDVPGGLMYKSMDCRLDQIAANIRVYFRLNKKFPAKEGDLCRNLESGLYSAECHPARDFWYTTLMYSVNGTTATLISAGADLKFETHDDLVTHIIVQDGTNTFWGGYEKSSWNYIMAQKNKQKSN